MFRKQRSRRSPQHGNHAVALGRTPTSIRLARVPGQPAIRIIMVRSPPDPDRAIDTRPSVSLVERNKDSDRFDARCNLRIGWRNVLLPHCAAKLL
jgi:hypothetical protein